MTTYEVKSKYVTIPLGRQGENNCRQVLFKSSYLTSGLNGGGEIVLLHQRKGDDAPYPVAITTEDEYIVWTVTSADVAVAGLGQCELQYIVDDVVKKSRIWDTRTLAALEEAGDAPDPETGWVAQMMAEIDEKLSAQGVDATEVNELIAQYLEDNPIETDTPVYDLADFGIAQIALVGGGYGVVTADVTELIEDLKSGAVTFVLNLYYDVSIQVTMTGYAAYSPTLGAYELTQVFFYDMNLLISVIIYEAGRIQLITSKLS